VAQCIAVLCIAAGGKQISSTVTKLLQALQAREAFSRHPYMLHQPARHAVGRLYMDVVRPACRPELACSNRGAGHAPLSHCP